MWTSIFTQEEISTGGPHEDTSIKHLSSIQAQRQTDYNPFATLPTFMDSGVLFFLVPSSPFPSSLCCSCVLRYFIYPFLNIFLNWPIVIPLTPPVWCRFGSVCLWTDSPLWNGANVPLWDQSTVSWKWASISNFQNKLAASQNQAWTMGVLFFLVVGMQGRTEEGKDWGGRMSWGWNQRYAGSILAEDCPLPAHCVPCSMCGAVSTWKKWMNNLTDVGKKQTCCHHVLLRP